MSEKSPYRPTRSCPHRLCPPLHLGLIPIGTVIAFQILFTGFLSAVYGALLCVAVVAVLRLVERRSVTELLEHELLERAVGVVLVVRPVWAAVAAGMDAMYLLGGGVAVATLFAHPHRSLLPSSPWVGYVSAVLAVGIVLFDRFAHRQATRPVKPKRVYVPALGDTV